MGGAAPGAWPALQQVAAHLFTVQGRHEEALWLQLQVGWVGAALRSRLMLWAAAVLEQQRPEPHPTCNCSFPTSPPQLKSPAVFDYIARHALADRLAPYAAGAPRLLRCAARVAAGMALARPPRVSQPFQPEAQCPPSLSFLLRLPCCADLIELDEVKATALLVEECEAVAPAAVVAALQVRQAGFIP